MGMALSAPMLSRAGPNLNPPRRSPANRCDTARTSHAIHHRDYDLRNHDPRGVVGRAGPKTATLAEAHHIVVLGQYISEGWAFVAARLRPAASKDYENDFLPLSYGYRPGVGAQQAVKDLTVELQQSGLVKLDAGLCGGHHLLLRLLDPD